MSWPSNVVSPQLTFGLSGTAETDVTPSIAEQSELSLSSVLRANVPLQTLTSELMPSFCTPWTSTVPFLVDVERQLAARAPSSVLIVDLVGNSAPPKLRTPRQS